MDRTKAHSKRQILECLCWPAAIVLGICVFAVAFFGIESYFVSHTDTYVAKVDDHEISQQDWQGRLTELRQQLAATPNAPYTVADLEKPELKQQILEGMINQVLLQKANTDLGLAVSNESVRDTIGTDQGFQVDGRFDPGTYRAVLASRALALARLSRFEEAAEFALKAVGRPNAHAQIHGIATFCLALAGRLDEARSQLAEARRSVPGYGIDDLLMAMRFEPECERLFRDAAQRVGAA